ncbi:hypothetical protein [Limosilactobacillus antri]|nr:hypothetical protein [Limosilactobacillus antri]
MLLSSFDDYMFYWSIAHLFHTSLVTAYWVTNIVTVLLLVVTILVLIFKR